MPHPTRHRRRSLLIFSIVAAYLCATLAGPVAAAGPRPGAASQGTPSITTSPQSLALTLALGQSDTRSVAINNTSGQALTPSIYEAYPATPASQAQLSVAASLQHTGLPFQPETIDSQLRAELQRSPNRQADFLIYLRDQADLSAAYQITDWRQRGDYVYQTLQAHAEQSQRELRAALASRNLPYHQLWIVNAVLTRGSLSDAVAISGRSEVALVRANRIAQLPILQPALSTASQSRCSPDNASETVCWNIRQIGADRVWRDFGVTGRGIVVGGIDTGVSYRHPALTTQYRGYLGAGQYDHNYNWFDPKATYREPYDAGGHGSHTMGTMVAKGNGTADQPSVGVAPGAEWVAAQGCFGSACNEAELISSAQWMLAPTTLDGQQPRPDLRPMIINNSWAGGGNDYWYAGYVAAWRAAGIFPIFAAGNSGSACGSISSPGDYANVLAVGATDQNDDVATFSARGPTADGRIKPDLSAPGAYSGAGVGVLSTGPDDGEAYFSLQGTSMAAPHVAGLVALLWSANPALIGDYAATLAILRASSRSIADTSCNTPNIPNNTYGYGRVNAYTAVARARVDLPWLSISSLAGPVAAGASANLNITLDAAKVPGPGSYSARVLVFGAGLAQPPSTITIALTVSAGAHPVTLTGRVVSGETGAPLVAQVGVRGGQSVPTDSTGVYTLTLAAGNYSLVASARSFFASEQPIALTANARLADIALRPNYPHITSSASKPPGQLAIGQSGSFELTLGNSGTQPLYYRLRVLPDQFAAARSDEAGGPAFQWVDLPAGARALKLSDDGYAESVPLGLDFPFYSYVFTETLVASNGMLAFSPPNISYNSFTNGCFPDSSFFFYEIAPFRANLDPTSSGTIRFGTTNLGQARAFVLSYENIPLHDGPASATYSFQVLMYEDGRIVYQYKHLADLPSALAVGLQRAPLEYQKLGCGSSAPLYDGLAIELRPQVISTQWLHLSRSSGTLAPGAQQKITATLQWADSPARLQRGQIEIASTDPLRPTLLIPIEVDMLPAPHRRWLPFASLDR